MLTITRIHNSINAVAYMRRMIALMIDYKERRIVFNKLLKYNYLHIDLIAQ